VNSRAYYSILYVPISFYTMFINSSQLGLVTIQIWLRPSHDPLSFNMPLIGGYVTCRPTQRRPSSFAFIPSSRYLRIEHIHNHPSTSPSTSVFFCYLTDVILFTSFTYVFVRTVGPMYCLCSGGWPHVFVNSYINYIIITYIVIT
jgi:hypothetical protein